MHPGSIILNNEVLDRKVGWKNLAYHDGKKEVIMSLIKLAEATGSRFLVDVGDKVFRIATMKQKYTSIRRKFQRKVNGKKRKVPSPSPTKTGEQDR